MYRRLQGNDFSTSQQGFYEVVVESMTLSGLELLSILKAWIVGMIGASNQHVQLPALISRLGLQRW